MNLSSDFLFTVQEDKVLIVKKTKNKQEEELELFREQEELSLAQSAATRQRFSPVVSFQCKRFYCLTHWSRASMLQDWLMLLGAVIGVVADWLPQLKAFHRRRSVTVLLVLFSVRRHVPSLHTSIAVPEVYPSVHLNVVSASLTRPGNYTNATGGELMSKWEDITAVAIVNDPLTN